MKPMSKLLKLGWTLWLLATLTGCVPTPTPPPLITLEVLPTPTPTRALGGPNAIVLALPPGLTAPEKLNSAHYLADQISRQTGLSVTVTVLASYAAVIDGMEQGTVHMAWLPPFAYMAAQERGAATVTLLSERFGATRRPVQFIANANWLQVRYTPTPTRTPRPTRTPTPTLTPTGQPSVTGTPTPVITQTAVPTPLPTRTPIPVFLTNEHLETLQRLAGYRPCWSARTSASYIMPAGIFALAGIRTQPGKFLANDEAVVEAVYNSPNGEQCDFGVTVMDAHLDSRLTDVATQVQVVYFSGPIIPFENVAFASTLTQAQQDRLTNVWLAIAETTLGRRALKDVFNVDGLERGDDSLYDSFRSYLEASGAEPETLIE